MDYRLHDRAIGTMPLKKGPLKGGTLDMDSLKKEFYETVGWDINTGGPTKEKLKELSISSLFSL